jgi:hypothetical protein
MKKVIQVTEVDGEGLEAFIYERIFIVCRSYFYAGTLTRIYDDCVLLEDARFVLESGSFEGKGIANSEKVNGGKIYVTKNSIESFFQSHE